MQGWNEVHKRVKRGRKQWPHVLMHVFNGCLELPNLHSQWEACFQVPFSKAYLSQTLHSLTHLRHSVQWLQNCWHVSHLCSIWWISPHREIVSKRNRVRWKGLLLSFRTRYKPRDNIVFWWRYRLIFEGNACQQFCCWHF